MQLYMQCLQDSNIQICVKALKLNPVNNFQNVITITLHSLALIYYS